MNTRIKAITVLVLVSFLYSNLLWAVGPQVYKLADTSNAEEVSGLASRLIEGIGSGKIQEEDLPPELKDLYDLIPKHDSPKKLTPSEIALIEARIRGTDVALFKNLLMRLLPDRGALIGKIVDENGEIITEYVIGEVKGDYLYLWDSRKPKKKPVAKIRCKKEYVKEEMIFGLEELYLERRLPADSAAARYICAIIKYLGYSISNGTGFYVLKEDVKKIYGFANERLFSLYEPFLSIPAAFFHEAGESFFLSDNYKNFLSRELGHELAADEWNRYKGKARIVVDGQEILIPSHTYLRGLGKKARAGERELTEAERLLPDGKGLEDWLFGEENIAVSRMIEEQRAITDALSRLGDEEWVKRLIPELKKLHAGAGFTSFFPQRTDKEIVKFLQDVIQAQSISKFLDILLEQLLRPDRENPNLSIDLFGCITELDELLKILEQHVPYLKVNRFLRIASGLITGMKEVLGKGINLEQWRKSRFIMKAFVRFFKRMEKAELHHHLDGALSPGLILKVLCLFPEAREQFVRNIMGRQSGSVNEIFSREIGGPSTEEAWEGLQNSLQYLFSGRVHNKDALESVFIERFGGKSEYNKAVESIKKYLEYRPAEIGTVNIIEMLKKFGLTGLALYCNPEALRIVARESTLETFNDDNTILIEQKMHNLTFGYPLSIVVQKVLQGLREAEVVGKGKLKTALIMCIFKNAELVLGERYSQIVQASQNDKRTIEEIRFSIWQEIEQMLQNDYGDSVELRNEYPAQEKKELDEAIAELRRMVDRKMPGVDEQTRENEVRKRLLIFWEERKEGLRQVREIIRVKQQLALNYPELAKRLVAIDTVGSEVDYITWVHSYSLRLARKYGFRITDHAGESWPEEDIWQALNRIKGAAETGVVERIGHATALGIHPEALRESRFPDGRPMYTLDEIKEIEALQRKILRVIKERGILIETNPSSNLLLLPKYITSYSRHPIQYFWRNLKGLLVVSSDDPHILHTIGLSGELAKVWLAHPNFKFGELVRIIRNGFENSFLASGDDRPALHMPLWDGIPPQAGPEDLSGYHPSSIVNRVRNFDGLLPTLDYQEIGKYPEELVTLEKSLTVYAAGWDKTERGDCGTLIAPAGMPAINMMVDSAIERNGLPLNEVEIIVIEPPYGCTKNLFENWQRRGVLVHSINVDEVNEKLPGLINDRTAIVYGESVTNPNLRLLDIEAVLRINYGRAAVLIDDTFATPEMIRSLEKEVEVDGVKYSVDMVMLGLTKGMSGTGNIIGGAVAAKREWLDILARYRNCLPERAEIRRAIRGLRHLEIRFNAQSRNACEIISRIGQGDLVSDTVYPGDGYMIYYVFKELSSAINNINLLPKFRTLISAVSLGQLRNLFERPSGGTHFTVDEEARGMGGISPAGVRGSIGIEALEDVIREITAILGLLSESITDSDLQDINRIFMAEGVTQEEGKRTVKYLLPKWPIPNATFERLISDLLEAERVRLTQRYNEDERFRKIVDMIMQTTEITRYDPVTIAIHHRLLWCLLSGNHNSVIASPDESTTTHKQDDSDMQGAFASLLEGKRKGFPPDGCFRLYSRLGRPGILTFEMLMTMLEAGIEQALNFDYIGTSFYSERMAHKVFLEQQAEIAKIGGDAEKREIIIVTPPDSPLFREAMGLVQHDAVRFRVITSPEAIDVSDKTALVYFDSLRFSGIDPVKIRDIVRKKNPDCVFGITDSFNLGYVDPRPERNFDFVTHVIYYEDSDYGAVIIAKNDKPLTQVWNNPYWSRKNRGVAMSEDIATMAMWYILPYLRVFDERYEENVNAVSEALKGAAGLRRVDKRHIEISFTIEVDKEKFLAIAKRSNLIDATSGRTDEYFFINEWTSIRSHAKEPNTLIIRVGIENTGDLAKEFGRMISRFREDGSGAIGKGSCLAEKDTVEVEDLNDTQKDLVRDRIEKMEEIISRAELTDAGRDQALQVVQLLKEYLDRGDIKVFDARVKDPEDYLLAFPRQKDHIIALARDFLDKDYIIQFYYSLPEILFHEGFTVIFGERDYEEHRRIYLGLQRKIFGRENPLAGALRYYINLKLPGEYRIDCDTKTEDDENIDIDRIKRLLKDKEFVYRTIKRVFGQDDLSYLGIERIEVIHGGTGSQKQTLHVILYSGGIKVSNFALKVAINEARYTGFSKTDREEIPTLMKISGKCNVPRFGVYIEESGSFYAYTEEWIKGPTAEEVLSKGQLTNKKIQNIVMAYATVISALNKRPKGGLYLGIEDSHRWNVMFRSSKSDFAVCVDMGELYYLEPLYYLQQFDLFYGNGDRECIASILNGVMNGFGKRRRMDAIKFLEKALDNYSENTRDDPDYPRARTERLVELLKEYLAELYVREFASRINKRLSDLAFYILENMSMPLESSGILDEIEKLDTEIYWMEDEIRGAYRFEPNLLSKEFKFEMVQIFINSLSAIGVDLEILPKITFNLDLVEKLLDVSFMLDAIIGGNINYAQLPDGARVIDFKNSGIKPIGAHPGRHTVPPKDMLDMLELNGDDIYLTLGGGSGINNIAACLRGVKKSIYVDISERNISHVKKLKRYFGIIKNNPGMRDRIENKAINNVGNFVKEIEILGEISTEEAPIDIYQADAIYLPLVDNSVTKISILELLKWIISQGGSAKVIRLFRGVLRVIREGGFIFVRADTIQEREHVELLPEIAKVMGITIRLEKAAPDGVKVFRVVSKSGDLYDAVVKTINKEIGLTLSSEELRSIPDGSLLDIFRADNGRVDREDLIMAERITKIVDSFYLSSELKLKLIQGIISLIRKKFIDAKDRIKRQISQYAPLKARIGDHGSKTKYIVIDKECLPQNQRYILEGDEWARRKQLLERMFPGYIFTGSLESGMNKDNAIVLTNKDMELDARLLCIQNAGEDEYFPIDGLIFLGIGLLNLSSGDTPLVSTVQNLYKELTSKYMDIEVFLKTRRLNIQLQPIAKFDAGIELYAISLLEQAA